LQEVKLDIFKPKEDQLKILVPYLKQAASYPKGEEPELPITTRTRVMIDRYLGGWRELFNKGGMTAEGAFLYYRKMKEDK